MDGRDTTARAGGEVKSGRKVRISGWAKKSQRGTSYLSLAVQWNDEAAAKAAQSAQDRRQAPREEVDPFEGLGF